MSQHPWFLAASRLLSRLFPGDRQHLRLVDLGCLEGGYSVEFSRMEFQVTGIEVRDSNMRACQFVKSKTSLPNLRFIHDDAWIVANAGPFDITFCCGLFYHLDHPRAFLELLSRVTSQVLILQTHVSIDAIDPVPSLWG